MKFEKEFTEHMVPEWQEVYMDYTKLKSFLKEIQQSRQGNMRPATQHFSGLTQGQPILVNSVHRDGSEVKETTFLMVSEEGGEYELVYFRRLDDEFNKVEQFYRSKLEELRKKGDKLDKQMVAFIAFKIKVENPLEFDRSVEITPLASHVPTNTAAFVSFNTQGTTSNRSFSTVMEAMDEESTQQEQRSDDSSDCKLEEEKMNLQNANVSIVIEAIAEEITEHEEQSDDSSESELEEEKTTNQKVEEQKPKNRPAPLEVLNRVHINSPLKTPCSTIKGLLNCQDPGELNYNRKNFEKVEQQLKRAFIEFYQDLLLLKDYSFQNILAFSKIMKKYDKIASRGAAEVYMNMVDKSYVGSNDEVTELIEWVEKTFIKHFAKSNRSKGLSILRPRAKRERHAITCTVGFFAGCTICLLVALILIICTRKIYKQPGTTQYMATLFPLYSLFGFIVLHILMIAANIYFWRQYRVNYAFLFGFKKRQELSLRGVLLFSFGIAVLALSCVLAKLGMQVDPNTQDYTASTELLPLILLLSLILILLCPFNVFYRSDRIFFLTCLFRCICAPFYKVRLQDFFLADQFISQVQALRSLEFYICYYGWGDFKHGQCNCKDYTIFRTFSFIVAAIPYWTRFLQCLRRLYQDKDPVHGYNALRYFIAIAAVSLRTAYTLDGGKERQVLAFIFSVAAAIFCTYWDLVKDWGLLHRHSKNPWLRDKLTIPQKSVYFAAIVLNVLLRFAWLPTILNLKFSFSHGEAMLCLFASLEIIRRGIWNFFRLENEHLNNVGKYRAFKSVPLPFNYDEDEDII